MNSRMQLLYKERERERESESEKERERDGMKSGCVTPTIVAGSVMPLN